MLCHFFCQRTLSCCLCSVNDWRRGRNSCSVWNRCHSTHTHTNTRVSSGLISPYVCKFVCSTGVECIQSAKSRTTTGAGQTDPTQTGHTHLTHIHIRSLESRFYIFFIDLNMIKLKHQNRFSHNIEKKKAIRFLLIHFCYDGQLVSQAECVEWDNVHAAVCQLEDRRRCLTQQELRVDQLSESTLTIKQPVSQFIRQCNCESVGGVVPCFQRRNCSTGRSNCRDWGRSYCRKRSGLAK